ncbi:hypothetical protein PORY_000897 [Pneumocystis oryctolagi]|uniref:Uncharacterized protein n=1 Tax=Pneumocystis oryctolagi TaxID=42067 RepID=A0ACB7CDY9_9ASCO|nr:hypothetical protein PORY_000897 [Pneumocystis oryctolagi]
MAALETTGTARKKTKNNKTFQCSGFGNCCMQFSRNEHLARHIRKHTGERPFKCFCGRTFSRLDNLRQHAQTIHTNDTVQSPYAIAPAQTSTQAPTALSMTSTVSSTTSTAITVTAATVTSTSPPPPTTTTTTTTPTTTTSTTEFVGTARIPISAVSDHDVHHTEQQSEHQTELRSEHLSSIVLENGPMVHDTINNIKSSACCAFVNNHCQQPRGISDTYDLSKSFSSSLFTHSPKHDSLLSNTDIIPFTLSSKFSVSNLNTKDFFPSSGGSSSQNEYQNDSPFPRQNLCSNINNNDFSKTKYHLQNSLLETLNNSTSSCSSSVLTTPNLSETNNWDLHDNKLPSVTILMDYDLRDSNMLSSPDMDKHSSIPTLKHDTQKMSIQFLCNQNITMGGIDILAEVWVCYLITLVWVFSKEQYYEI